MRRQRFRQSLLIFLGCLGLCMGLVLACQREQPLSEAAPPTPVMTQLAAVESLSPPPLPDWLAAISPLGSTQPEAQIRIQFRDPVIPLSQLDAPAAASLLEFFELTPALAGQFRILTPHMIAFQADQALPIATRVQVRLKAGLSDTLGNTLTEDLVWSFETPALTLQLQDSELSDLPTRPEIALQANAPLDLEATQVRVVDNDSGSTKSVRLVAVADDPLGYVIKPELVANQRYSLEISPVPAVGNQPGRTLQRNLSTYQPLALRALERYGAPDGWSAQGRFSNGAPLLRFNNAVTRTSLEQALRLDPPAKADVPLFRLYGDTANQVEINPWALEPQTSYSLTLGTELSDIFGQRLSQAETARFSTADLAPDIWLPEGLHIFPRGLDVSLNINSLNLPAGYRFARRPLEPRDLVFREAAYPNNQPDDLLPGPESWPLTPLEGERNETLTTEVSLPGTGVTAYGVTAQLYQYTDFDNERRWAERQFYGLVLQTNLGLFAQWFPTGGLVRVHHLDDGQPVANVRVELYRSALYRDPEPGDGDVCAAGETDADGVVRFARSQLQRCQPDVNQPPEILAVAQEADDWSFVRTQSFSGAYSYGILPTGKLNLRWVPFSLIGSFINPVKRPTGLA
ncbi:MAG: hypothetical protein HC926_05040 [Synechococcaceae cyanobacterium SM2_3_60]|nr:hypothetical protein [Synechococcaceae cyanobacterium SM2_3_60]